MATSWERGTSLDELGSRPIAAGPEEAIAAYDQQQTLPDHPVG
jgi:hypothetical protein